MAFMSHRIHFLLAVEYCTSLAWVSAHRSSLLTDGEVEEVRHAAGRELRVSGERQGSETCEVSEMFNCLV